MIYVICLTLPPKNDLTMRYPLSPVLGNILIYSFEIRWFWYCPDDFFCRSAVDNIFALFSFPDDADKFNKYLSCKHVSMNISVQKGKESCLFFFDVKIFHENGKFASNIYKKVTFSRIYTNFKSFVPETFKIGFIMSFFFWYFSFWSDRIKFYYRLIHLAIGYFLL